jgi:hypothetical protein
MAASGTVQTCELAAITHVLPLSPVLVLAGANLSGRGHETTGNRSTHLAGAELAKKTQRER